MPAAQDIAGVKAQTPPTLGAGDAAAGGGKSAAMPFTEALKLLCAETDGEKEKNPQEETVSAAQTANIFLAGVLPGQFTNPGGGGETIKQAALQETEAVVESLAGKAGDIRQALLNMKQPTVLPEKGELSAITPAGETASLKEDLPLNFAPAPERPSEKSVNARELFGEKLVVVKDGISLPDSAPWQKAPADAAAKAVSVLGAPVLATPAESKKILPDEKAAPSDKAVQGEKAAPDFGVKAPGRIEAAAAYGYEKPPTAADQPQERPASAEAAAPLSRKETGEEPETEESVQTKDTVQTAGREAIVAGTSAKDSFAQKLDFNEQELDLKDAQDLANRLVEQAKLTQRPGGSEMTIRLRPQNLGELTVRIIAENGGAISAAFHSNNSEVRGILQEALPAIRQELSNSGLKVNDVGVYAGLGDFQSFAQNQPGNQPDGKANKISRLRRAAEEQTPAEELTAYTGKIQNGTGGVDYRV
jgi:hypothetical protein